LLALRPLSVAFAIRRTGRRQGYTSGMSRRGLDITSLTPEERLSLLEELWDSLAAAPDAVPLTEAQRTELDRRLDDLDREGPVGIPWEEVLSRIRSRHR
jgi:putative addiction module component (TIGR02574 family)